MFTGFHLLYYYTCVVTINKTHAGLTKILLDRFDDRNMTFLLFHGNNCSKFLKYKELLFCKYEFCVFFFKIFIIRVATN